MTKRACWAMGAVVVGLLNAGCVGHSHEAIMSASHTGASTGGRGLALTQYVDPMIGTDQSPPLVPAIAQTESPPEDLGGGFTTPAATLPAGMVQWGPDTPSVTHTWSPPGYHYGQTSITGFSLTHLSGVGCPGGGALPVLPIVAGQMGAASFKHTNETARPGYYGVTLDNGIRTELTATLRSGAGRFTWPVGQAGQLNVAASTNASSQGGTITIDPNDPEALSGSMNGGDFCSSGQTYKIYFYAQLDQPFTTKLSAGNALLTFTSTLRTPLTVNMKVGVSYVSIQNAKDNLQREAGTLGFDEIAKRADAAWNRELSAIEVTGGNTDDVKKFYTALYHALLAPSVFSDANGDYVAMNGKVINAGAGHVHYTTFSSWDTYRSLMPLIAWLKPAAASDMMQSLVDDASTCGGAFPKWVEGNTNSDVMPGDNVPIVVAQSYMYGATSFDTQKALSIMLRTASGAATTCRNVTALPGLVLYKQLGYLPADANIRIDSSHNGGTASTTLEYATTDYAISRYALALGDITNAAKMRTRSANWRNVIRPAFSATPPRLSDRDSNGSWVANSFDEVEGNVEQYTWMVPFDIPGLIHTLGGDAAVLPRLDTFNAYLNAGSHSPHLWIGNEPSFATPWLYNWTSRPDKTQALVRRIVNEQFTTAASGLPGNDDEGATSGWFVWAALGLYPEVPAVSGFTLSSPLFSHVTIRLADGKILEINADHAGSTYVQDVTLNGSALTSTWIDFDRVGNGGTLEFHLGDAPSSWGQSAATR
ncbi:GH92 family glycosyl hydrolase [Dyella caseinilytica]|uniref:GH92 family glycosyl hydrolase n=1 Tax=Dyella caseinilytica TaxID=1849581 RepID=A0ABX7GYQ8_9GAMM|nr:GH92 family glycosyl hydrolase [Dyella caseinilytica]QRN55645.1 GH92 family glycosyl hydrolase [Dyella caseinilytica]GGA03382.1 alpha-1 2-mannosidase [Dyella caseinilytica]